MLKGSATLRLGVHRQPLAAGNFIAKPTGPDLPSHILADQGEAVTIFDIQVYPDPRQSLWGQDVMDYPDHQELVLTAIGVVPQKTFQPRQDVFAHYFEGYLREEDGTVTHRTLPGEPARPNDTPRR